MQVYVFGAGASVPYGAPVTAQLLVEAFLNWSLIPRTSIKFESELKTVARAIDYKYGTHLAAFADGQEPPDVPSRIALGKINVEDLIYHAEEAGDEQLLKALHIVIFKTIEKNLAYDHDNGEYERLVKHVKASCHPACFISFNYDLLLDRALAKHARGHWSYEVPFDAGIDENFPFYPMGTANPSIYLLKLHGSFNWYQCIACEAARAYYFRRFQPLLYDFFSCKQCSGDQFRPFLVPPTPAKQYPSSLERAWERAAACLEQATELRVVGYSFPSVDRRVRELFLGHFIIPNLNRLDFPGRPRLTLVNPNSYLLDSIQDLFAPAVEKIRRFPKFENFVKSLDGAPDGTGATV